MVLQIVADSVTEGASETAEKLFSLASYLKELLPELATFIVHLVIALIAFWIGCRLINLIMHILEKYLNKRGVEATSSEYIKSALNILLKILLAIAILAQLGVKEATIIAALGSIGVGIGLAVQGAAGNMAGGILILINKPFKVGDFIVEVNEGNQGFVEKIDLLYTTLKSLGAMRIVIPNSKLTDASVINMTATGLWIEDIAVGISYGDDIQKAREVLLGLAKSDPDVLQDMEMYVFVDSFGDSSIKIGLRCWTTVENHFSVLWRLQENIKTEFEKAGITIAFSQLDVHLDTLPDKTEKMGGESSRQIREGGR